MRTPLQVSRNISFLKQLWKNKVAVRALLSSQNFVVVSDYLPGHFYSPIPDLREIDANVDAIFNRSGKTVGAINLNERKQLWLIHAFATTYKEMPLRAFLQYNAAFEILFFNSFIASHHAESIKRVMPQLLRVPSTKETEGNSSI